MIKILLTAIMLLCVSTAHAHEQLLTAYIDAFQNGNIEHMPISADASNVEGIPLVLIYSDIFASSSYRRLVLKNIRWTDDRITADYYVLVDHQETSGSLIMFVKDQRIERLVTDTVIYEESETNVADAGQAADKISTAVAVGTGTGAEMNPALASFGPAGFLAFGGAVIVGRKAITQGRDVSTKECVEGSKLMGSVGWGAAGNNILVMAGAGPVSLIGGVVAWTVAKKQNYKGSCVSGPIQITQLVVD